MDELFDEHLDSLTQSFHVLRDQACKRPEARETFDFALREMAQAIFSLHVAREIEIRHLDATEGEDASVEFAGQNDLIKYILSTSPDSFVVIDRDFNVVMGNWKEANLAGGKAISKGLKCYEMFHNREHPCEDCHVLHILATGKPLVVEKVDHRKGRVYENSSFPILDESGQVIMVAEHIRDITALRETEKALQEREELYRVLSEGSLAGVYLLQDNTFLYVNPKMAEIFGYAPEEIINRMKPRDLIHPDDHPLLNEKIRQRLTGEAEEAHYIARGIRRDGSEIQVEFLGRRVEYQGRPAIIGTLLDITSRKEAEEALKTQALVLNSMTEAVHAVDEDGNIVFANPALYAMFGYSEGELLGQRVTVLNDMPPEESERFAQGIKDQLQGKDTWSGEVRNRTKAGTSILTAARVSTLKLPHKKLWVAVHEDITARKHLEEATEGYLQFIRLLLETIPNPVFYRDPQGMIQGCNKAFATELGVLQEDMPGKTVYELFPEEVASKCEEGDKKALEQPGTLIKMEFQLTGPDGALRHKVCNKAAYIDSSGSPGGVVSITTDITELKQAEAALRESEARFRAIIDNAQDAIFVKDPSFNYAMINPSAAKILNLSIDRIVGRSDYDLFAKEDADRTWEEDQRVVSGETVNSINSFLIDGQPMTFHVVKAPLRDDSGEVTGICGIARDITPLQQIQDALRENEKILRTLIEANPESLFLLDTEGVVLAASNVGAERLGISREKLIGANIFSMFPPELRQKRFELFKHLVATGQPVEQEESRGSFHFFVKIIPIKKRDKVVQVVVLAVDISSRIRAEEALKESEARYRTLFETSPHGTVLMDLQLNILMANQRGLRLFGFNRLEEVIDRNGVGFIDPEDQAKVLPLIQDMFETGESRTADVRVLRQDGTKVPCLVTASLVRDAAGDPQAVIGVAQDISDLKRAEADLKAHLQFMRVLMDAIPNPMFYKDVHGAYLGCNKAFKDLMGISQEEIVGKTLHDLHPKELADRYHQMDRALLQNPGSQVYETPLMSADGTIHQVLASKSTFLDTEGRIAGLVGTILDLSELRRAEEAVRESEARLRAIFEYAPVGITMVDATGRFLQTNPAFQAIVGYSAAELREITFQQLTHPQDLSENLRLQEELLAGQRQHYSLEKRLFRKDGALIFVSAMVSQLEHQKGTPRLVGTIIDITARKRAEEALRESEQRFRLMAETIQDSFWIANAKLDELVYVSPGFERIWGRSAGNLSESNLSFMEAIHPDDLERVKAQHKKTLEDFRPWSSEYRIIRPDATVRWVQDRGYPVRDDKGRIIMYTGVCTDITERKTLEQQLLLAQKMEAVGRLAGGIAHDFNNLLMTIAGYGELMQAKVFKGDPLYDYLEDILKTIDRAAALTGQLLTFSRQQIVYPQVIDLNSAVLEMERMLRRLIEEDIELKIITAPKLGSVQIDPGSLNQIIMNLVINARDAMLCGGTIVVETDEVNFDTSRQTRSGVAPPGSYVVLQVSDNGIGMDENIQAYIFEPFFTTKEIGKGTGLGLATVYGIIKHSGGFIDLESQPGLGTTFTIYFPRKDAAMKPPKKKIPQMKLLGGEETILLVEDEDALRTLLAKFLKLYGYKVLEARHGGEALLICEKHGRPIHLMVTDVVMPQMSGRELADRLNPLHPEMRVLYMSGYTEDEVVQRGVADLSVSFLQKPFKPIELVEQVHSMLHPPKDL